MASPGYLQNLFILYLYDFGMLLDGIKILSLPVSWSLFASADRVGTKPITYESENISSVTGLF